jgi:hypothetical protein
LEVEAQEWWSSFSWVSGFVWSKVVSVFEE